MKSKKIGRMDYSDLDTPPEKHERMTAKYFVGRGENVVFLKPSSIKGARSPDFAMRGKMWEVKSPTVYSHASFEYNFRKAMSQSKNIIFDLRRLNVRDSEKYLSELKKWGNMPTIKVLLVISKRGKLLTLRGKFDIIEA